MPLPLGTGTDNPEVGQAVSRGSRLLGSGGEGRRWEPLVLPAAAATGLRGHWTRLLAVRRIMICRAAVGAGHLAPVPADPEVAGSFGRCHRMHRSDGARPQ